VLYPVNLVLKGRRCLVVGGGKVALDKVRPLVRAGAKIRVVSPEFAAGLKKMRGIRRIRRTFRNGDLRGAFLVIAATDDAALNHRISKLCRARDILVNVIDDPKRCSFHSVSMIRRGDVAVTVSTGGRAPGLAKSLRLELERYYPKSLTQLLNSVSRTRRRLQRRGASMETLRKASDPQVLAAWRKGGVRRAEALIRRKLKDA
jgi:precorrin-2 dehydrogenase/sirohydrochlorin ferrochelatase